MGESKTPRSNASSYDEIGEYWDRHDLAEVWDETKEVSFAVDIESSIVYFAVDKGLAARVRLEAESRGTTAEALLNLWVQEHVGQER